MVRQDASIPGEVHGGDVQPDLTAAAGARALDRVTGDMINKARLAEERKPQFHHAWRRHDERRRRRERERQLRGL
jgi:hypothetical protein